MRCVTCGETMRLLQNVPDDTMFVSGYEHHILECLGCGEIERRLVFRHARAPRTKAPATSPSHEPDEVELAGAHAPDMGIIEPTASSFTPRPGLPAERQQQPAGWQHRIDNVRARLDDLRKRAELANQETRAAQQDQEERKRFTLFWDALAAHPASQPNQPITVRLAPLPKSLSLVPAPSLDIDADAASSSVAAPDFAKEHKPFPIPYPAAEPSPPRCAQAPAGSASSGSVLAQALSLVRQVLS